MRNLMKVHMQGSLGDLSTKLAFVMDDGTSYRVKFLDGMTEEQLAKQFIKMGENMLEGLKKNESS